MATSKRRREQDDGSHCHCDKRPSLPRQKKKHLYLVLDDWDMAYSIHKLEPDTGNGGRTKTKIGRLPQPPALRLGAPVDRSVAMVTALGSKMFIVTDYLSDDAPILIYDTNTAALTAGPPPPPAVLPGGFRFILPVGDRLYALNSKRADHKQNSFEVLSRDKPSEDYSRLSGRSERWSWATVASPLPFEHGELITAYAVHPDGRTVFVSTRSRTTRVAESTKGTYAFDTGSSVWTWLGDWTLPFLEQGYYVDELEAWVGLDRDGFICSCDVASRTTSRRPECRSIEETLFLENPEMHIGHSRPTLTYMGGAEFCLVECAARSQGLDSHKAHDALCFEDGLDSQEALDALCIEDGCVLHVTTLRLRYNKVGELQAMACHPPRSYLVSKYSKSFSACALWM